MKHHTVLTMMLVAGIMTVIMMAQPTTAMAGDPSPTREPTTRPGSDTQPSPRVLIETSQGDIIVELDRQRAPLTVANFLRYVGENAYANTIFHRVISGFMIQGGGYSTDYSKQPVHEPVKNEADNGLKNDRGTIAMARTPEPDSATRQFFINVVDNDFLNHNSPTMTGWGYAVFGRVIRGMDVVDRISKLPTGKGGPFPGDVPAEMVIIRHITEITGSGITTPTVE